MTPKRVKYKAPLRPIVPGLFFLKILTSCQWKRLRVSRQKASALDSLSFGNTSFLSPELEFILTGPPIPVTQWHDEHFRPSYGGVYRAGIEPASSIN